MALFSKKINIYELIPIVHLEKSPKPSLRFQTNSSQNVQVVNTPFTRRIWEVTVFVLTVAIPSVSQLKSVLL